MDNKNLQIAYIGGGSRGWAWGFMKDLALEGEICGTLRLYDIDLQAAQTNAVIGQRISQHKNAESKWSYQVSSSLSEALSGADFVVISILPGTFDEMQSDVHLPEKYGIYQAVGDTVGPGGLVRAMRTVPMFAQFAENIRRYCPDAWVINYTNPMSVCVRTLYEVFPQIKAFGCCHEVFGTQDLLMAMLKTEHGIKDIKRSDIHTNVLGINHFTWFDKASCRGIDLMPLYKEFADKYYKSGYGEYEVKGLNKSFLCRHRVKFDLFKRYGLIAAAGDRHLAEFMPPWYLKDAETVEGWDFGLTTVQWRKEDLQNRLSRAARLSSGEEEIDLEPTGEEGVMLIKALLGLNQLVSNVNIPNIGQIANLPAGAIVETNAVFRFNSISPVMAGNIPQNIHSLIMRHVDNQENTVKAALKCDYALALQIFLNDPLVNLLPCDADKLLREMLQNTAAFLPKEWKL